MEVRRLKCYDRVVTTLTAGDFGGWRAKGTATRNGNVIARSHDATHRDDVAISYSCFSAAIGEIFSTDSFISAFEPWKEIVPLSGIPIPSLMSPH